MCIDRSVAVGVEIVGGQTTVALIDRHGRVHRRLQAKTLRGRPASATLEPYLRAIDSLLAQAHVERLPVHGIGVSIPGVLAESKRTALAVPLLPSLNGFPLCDLLEARYAMPAQLQVDVDAAALGEYRFGAGKERSRLLFLHVNAVVGAAFVLDGHLEQTTDSSIGHVCHIAVSTSLNSPRCSCGKRGCINTFVSFEAMQKLVQRALRRGEESSLLQRMLLGHEHLSPRLLAEEAAHGDAVALQVYSELGRWLSVAITHYIDYFDPHILILGGDVAGTSNHLLTHVRSTLNNHSSARVCSLVEVVPALLGKDASIMGAAVSLL